MTLVFNIRKGLVCLLNVEFMIVCYFFSSNIFIINVVYQHLGCELILEKCMQSSKYIKKLSVYFKILCKYFN